MSESGFCSDMLILTADSTFFYEWGCEATSHISTGSWYVKRDTLFLSAVNKENVQPIKEVIPSIRKQNSDSISLRLISLDGDTLRDNFSPYLFRQGETISPEIPHDNYFSFNDTTCYSFDYDRGVYMFDTAGKTDNIEIRKLSEAFGRKIDINMNSNNSLDVIINFPKACLGSPFIEYDFKGISMFVICGDTLISYPEKYNSSKLVLHSSK